MIDYNYNESGYSYMIMSQRFPNNIILKNKWGEGPHIMKITDVRFLGSHMLYAQYYHNCDFTKFTSNPIFFSGNIFEDCLFPKKRSNWVFRNCRIIKHGMEWDIPDGIFLAGK